MGMMGMKNKLIFAAILALIFFFIPVDVLVLIGITTILILIHEVGHWIVARLLGLSVPVVSIGHGLPTDTCIVVGKWWGTEFQITPTFFLGGYTLISDEEIAIWRRALILVAGPATNMIVAFFIVFMSFFTIGQERLKSRVYIVEFTNNTSIARDAGLKTNDVIVSVDGNSIVNIEGVHSALLSGKETMVHIVVQRGNEKLSIAVKPDEDGFIGVKLGYEYAIAYQKMGTAKAARDTIQFMTDWLIRLWNKLITITMLQIVSLPKPTPGSLGPVLPGTESTYRCLLLIGLMSSGIGFFNILPIPNFDGGCLLFLLFEKIRGVPVAIETRAKILGVSRAVLIFIVSFALLNEIFS